VPFAKLADQFRGIDTGGQAGRKLHRHLRGDTNMRCEMSVRCYLLAELQKKDRNNVVSVKNMNWTISEKPWTIQ
jgi:hypothetical protein